MKAKEKDRVKYNPVFLLKQFEQKVPDPIYIQKFPSSCIIDLLMKELESFSESPITHSAMNTPGRLK